MDATRKGLVVGATAFLLWGVFPVYWKSLFWLESGQAIYLRVLFCVPVLLTVVGWHRQLGELGRQLRSWRVLGWHGLTALLLGLNWWAFIWATQHGRIVEASLGYFLTPLANVALGAVLLKEKLLPLQWWAVGLATFGVVLLISLTGSLPWIAFSLCVTFSLYGLLRKRSPLDSLLGLTVESLVAVPVALACAWLIPPVAPPQGASGWILIGLSGIITTVPLLCFAAAARNLPLATLGQLQFIAPSLQFLIGIAVGERINLLKFVAFTVIWMAIGLYLRVGLKNKN
jgi:chloramphenicol-sensitive protein RarD